MVNTEYSANTELKRAKSPGKVTVEARDVAQRIQVGSTNLQSNHSKDNSITNMSNITFLATNSIDMETANILLPAGVDYDYHV